MKLLQDKFQSPINGLNLLLMVNAFLLIYVAFFTTRIPFDPSNYASSFEVETSNVKNQVVYLFLFFSSLVILVRRFDTFITFVKAEKYLSIFVLLCLLSAFWTDYPELSIKRSFQLFVIYIVVILAIINIAPRVLLNQLRIIISLYLFINLFTGKLIPAAIDPVFQTWRGIEVHKNHLAQTSVYCLLSSLVLFNFDREKWTKIYDLVLMLIAVYLIYKAHSSSAVMVVAIILFLGFLFYAESIFTTLRVGRSVLGLIILFFLCFSVIFLIFSSDVFSLVPGYFGKDLTLSGRVPIWEYVWSEIEKKLFLGYGFAAYWIMGHPRILIFADYFEGFMVNQAHNGYLEIFLQLGIIGIISFLFIIIAYIYRMLKLNNNLAIIILISILTLNFTESVLFKVGQGVTTFFFFAAYMSVSYFYFNSYKLNSFEENGINNNSITNWNFPKSLNSNSRDHSKETSRY
jgi:O-antigen ligase